MADEIIQTDIWEKSKTEPTHLVEELLERWRGIWTRTAKMARRDDLSRSEIARRSGLPMGTLSPLLDGTYTGNYANQIAKLERWLDSVEEVRARSVAIPAEPGYIETATSRELVETLIYAQMMPEMVICTLGSGCGKTASAEHYVSTRPNAFMATMRPTTAGTHAMLQELAQSLEVMERNPARLDRAIGQKLKRNGRHTLLIIDEAQNLQDSAINQLRYFLDIYGCGIALLGNEEIYARYGKTEPREGYGQIHRRIGKKMRRITPRAEDVEAILDAWAVTGDENRKLLRAIGRKPGALGQIVKTYKLAAMYASGAGEPIGGQHIRDAWSNRSGESI